MTNCRVTNCRVTVLSSQNILAWSEGGETLVKAYHRAEQVRMGMAAAAAGMTSVAVAQVSTKTAPETVERAVTATLATGYASAAEQAVYLSSRYGEAARTRFRTPHAQALEGPLRRRPPTLRPRPPRQVRRSLTAYATAAGVRLEGLSQEELVRELITHKPKPRIERLAEILVSRLLTKYAKERIFMITFSRGPVLLP